MHEDSVNVANELLLLEAIFSSPETSQANLAAQVGVAVGTVNWYLKRWSQKGYVKIRRMGRWNWSYLLTPEGINHKAHLANEYVEVSLRLYRQTRAEAKRLLTTAKTAGYPRVYIDGAGELAEICQLTCLELRVQCQEQFESGIPVLRIEGHQLTLDLPDYRSI
jgi:DNA-binding MarR family transcriptional regulator